MQEATATITHITDVDAATITAGDQVEQGGEIYAVTEIKGTTTGTGYRPQAIYFRWTGAEESDVFRSVVNGRGYAGQIRWERPYRKPEPVYTDQLQSEPETLAEPVTFQTAMDTRCDACGEKAALHRLTSSGNFYCLIPASGYDHEWWTSSRPMYNYVRPVRELRRSTLAADLGAVILAGLSQGVAA